MVMLGAASVDIEGESTQGGIMSVERTLKAAVAALLAAAALAAVGVTPGAAALAAPEAPGAASSTVTAADPAVTAPDPAVTPTDYSQPAHWLHVQQAPRQPVDVFYVYPTAYSRTDPSQPIFCPVDNPVMVQGAQAAYTRQAWAFRTFANIYAPYYRQIDAAYQLSLPPAEQEKNIEGPPAVDVLAAFKYYLGHYNHGRPYILAGHSQGSAVLRYLLSSYMQSHPRVYGRMVAAYIVGQSVTPTYLADNPHLEYAKGAGDTGVIVSWNTEAPTVDGANPVLLPGGIAMNPITWTRARTPATARQNPGSIQLDPTTGRPLMNKQGRVLRVTGLADARVDKKRGVVVCSTVPADQPPYYSPHGFPMGVLHTFDYPLYFFSVRANAAERAANFLAAHPKLK
jgi:hypothetical protein